MRFTKGVSYYFDKGPFITLNTEASQLHSTESNALHSIDLKTWVHTLTWP